jgi:geranylgeranyl diphosphate synthase type II
VQAYIGFLNLFSSHLKTYSNQLRTFQPKELYLPGEYILSLGGKRVRPLLALIACDLFDKKHEDALNSALAVELFHNFSLIHDDILDEAPKRRNKATVHKKWSTNIAILSGDIMLVKAIQELLKHPHKKNDELIAIFLKTAAQVCEGQQMDMNFEVQNNVRVDDYIHMITLKTAVLLGCSLQMGAIVSDANKKVQHQLFEFGKHLGIAFQLMDDYLDVYATKKQAFGKQIGGDIIANKKTFLLLKAFELSDKKIKNELNTALKISQQNKLKIKSVKAIYQRLKIDEICLLEAEKHTKIALDCLSNIKANEFKKENLKSFALQLLSRKT